MQAAQGPGRQKYMETLRVLLLEPDALDAGRMLQCLSDAGITIDAHHVETEADFSRALQDAAWDLILADYAPPGLDGLSILKLARERCPDVPFIFVSGVAGEERAIESLKNGATDYVLKDRLERLPLSVHRARREAEERLERTRAEDALRFLARASAVLTSSLDCEETLSRLAHLAVPHLADGCIVDLLEPDGTLRLVAIAHSDAQQEDALRALRANHPFDPDANFGAALVLRTGQPEVVPHFTPSMLAELGSGQAHRAAIGGISVRSYMAIPLVSQDQVLGVLSLVATRSERAYDEVELNVAQDLASRAAVAVDNARLYIEMQKAVSARDEFLATISHELRTPLNAILGWTQMLRTGGLDEETATQALEIVERNTRAQSKLIADLLEVSRAITGKLRLQLGPVEMSMVIEAALNAVRPAAEVKAIQLSYSHEGSGLVAGDPHRLQQVLWNLLSNAIKFTPRDGSVQIRMERVATSLQITVSDTGQGIDPAFLPFLFERFRQADSSSTRVHGGMGLGLAIVRHLIELHGGTVHAHSEGEDRGTTFTVELPLMAIRLEESPSQAEARRFAESLLPQAPAEIDLRGVHVVVVDDQVGARKLVAAVFEASGARVSAFASSLPALEFLESADNGADVLVSDIGMPGEDGCAFIQRLREQETASRKSPLPALALSAFAHPKDVERALCAGFQKYMVKPAEPTELVKQVAALANR